MDNIIIDGYIDYGQMSDTDKRKVDNLYESYKSGGLDGTSTDQVEYFIARRLNQDVIKQMNDKLDQIEEYSRYSSNYLNRRGSYHQGLYSQDGTEVAALKKEVSEMKDTIGELTRLLTEKLV